MKDKKTLCELASEKNTVGIKKLAVGAKYLCSGCFRVSSDPERICCDAVLIEDKSFLKKIVSKIGSKLEEKSKKNFS
jgi:hypothetical protein